MTIDEMRNRLDKYCKGFDLCVDGCPLSADHGSCRWIENSDKSTEDCYWFLVNEGLIGKPEQPEINFVKAERNDEVEPTNNAVQHPSHYTHGGIECIEAIKASMTADGFCDYCKGNIIKYIWRWRDKGGVEDLRKASVYLDWLINAAEGKERREQQVKAIKKSTLLELARIVRKYARTGDRDILSSKLETAKKLATQAYGKDNAWLPFADFMNATVGVYALYPECTDKEICDLFKALKFEVLDE